MRKTEPEEILHFISRFTDRNRRPQVITTFTQGCCYWFAYILCRRFESPFNNTDIAYDPIVNHFGCRINGRVYDITGDCTDQYSWKDWMDVYISDTLAGDRIIRDCIRMEELQ